MFVVEACHNISYGFIGPRLACRRILDLMYANVPSAIVPNKVNRIAFCRRFTSVFNLTSLSQKFKISGTE